MRRDERWGSEKGAGPPGGAGRSSPLRGRNDAAHPKRFILASHLVLHGYGHWLSNDPRGSGSESIRKDELKALGEIHHGRKKVQPPRDELKAFYRNAEPLLEHEPLWFDDAIRRTIARAIGEAARRHGYTIWALSVCSNHGHGVVRFAPRPFGGDLATVRGGFSRCAAEGGSGSRAPPGVVAPSVQGVPVHRRRRERADPVRRGQSREGRSPAAAVGMRAGIFAAGQEAVRWLADPPRRASGDRPELALRGSLCGSSRVQNPASLLEFPDRFVAMRTLLSRRGLRRGNVKGVTSRGSRAHPLLNSQVRRFFAVDSFQPPAVQARGCYVAPGVLSAVSDRSARVGGGLPEVPLPPRRLLQPCPG